MKSAGLTLSLVYILKTVLGWESYKRCHRKEAELLNWNNGSQRQKKRCLAEST